MALESGLWKLVRSAGIDLRRLGHKVHLCRIENEAGSGNPDVEGCINGDQLWIELKSEERPKRASTPIRPKLRPSQDIWHTERYRAGCRVHWVLLRVGEDRETSLYLIPGRFYAQLKAITETELQALSVLPSEARLVEILLRSTEPYEA